VETGARSLQHTLEAIKQRHLELIAPRVREALRSDAVAATAYATSEETSSLLLACTYPILWFVQAELDPTAAGSPRTLIVAMRKPIRKVPVTEVQRLLSPPIQRLLVAGLGGAATLIGPMGAHDRKYALVDDLQALLLPTSGRITLALAARRRGADT
jgi:hypothetical protein